MMRTGNESQEAVLVVGSVAYDTVKTPVGSRVDALGGSATYFSIVGSNFAPVSVVAVVGEDFRKEHIELLETRRIDTSGLQQVPGETFRWSGVYGENLNTRETLETRLNVFAEFRPVLREDQQSHQYLFLANIGPELQLEVLNQMRRRPRLVALDTMNFWIEGNRETLTRAVEAVDVLFLDEGEAKSFSGESNLVKAAARIRDMGPGTVVIKRGEHGAMLFREGSVFVAPAYPLETVVDPTGAGDSFAGGFMGYLTATGDLTDRGFRRAAALGSVMGSFAVEDFSTERVEALTRDEIESRFREFTALLQIDPLTQEESLPWRD